MELCLNTDREGYDLLEQWGAILSTWWVVLIK